ncbi:hypothetical protein [Bacillus pinisoli]|uniref:hypothetical protein n=1 Tax=Bacillus pinisoli TaxID=2901866 RepID=UPI001FF4653E|nr:hypothetical protein [Bacillus pinisoli]
MNDSNNQHTSKRPVRKEDVILSVIFFGGIFLFYLFIVNDEYMEKYGLRARVEISRYLDVDIEEIPKPSKVSVDRNYETGEFLPPVITETNKVTFKITYKEEVYNIELIEYVLDSGLARIELKNIIGDKFINSSDEKVESKDNIGSKVVDTESKEKQKKTNIEEINQKNQENRIVGNTQITDEITTRDSSVEYEDIVINYSINDKGVTITDGPTSETINLKIGQKIQLNAQISNNSTERVLVDGTIMEFIDETTIIAVKKGTGDLNILPNENWGIVKVYKIIIE